MKNEVVLTKRGRMKQIPNPPKAKIAFIKQLPPLGEINLYYFDGQYLRSKRGFPDVGAGEFGELIGA